MTPTVLIVDDHGPFRAFARSMFEAEGFAVAADACSGELALEAVRQHRPDLVLLDVNLPGIDGFEVARQLGAIDDPPAIVMTSTREASDLGCRLSAAPIRGFVPKAKLSAASVVALAGLS